MIHIITRICLRVPRKLNRFKRECLQVEGITARNTAYYSTCLLYGNKENILVIAFCIVVGNHTTVVSAQSLRLTSKNLFYVIHSNTLRKSCRHIQSHPSAIIHSVSNSVLRMVNHKSMGLKLPDFIALPGLMPTRWKKRKIRTRTLLLMVHGNKAEIC